jgi:hypothetical protein
MDEQIRKPLLVNNDGRWINSTLNPEFNSEDLLILKPGKKLDYGLNPVATVKNYKKLSDGDWSIDVYELVVEYKAPVFDLATKNVINFTTCVKTDVRSKFNAEELFQKANVNSVDEALKLYKNQ